jgi:phosphonate transport system substrate-binding protein
VPAGVLTFGSVSLNPVREFEMFRSFADHVAANLHEVGIGTGRVVVVGSLNQMVVELREGRVDIYIDSPFPAAFVWRHGDVRPILRRWKGGAEVYRSIVFTRADNGVESLDDLAGVRRVLLDVWLFDAQGSALFGRFEICPLRGPRGYDPVRSCRLRLFQ